jgi:dihydropteroate synthase
MMLAVPSSSLVDRQVMAIINLTPDSFYSPSRHVDYGDVCRSVERAISDGATILDLGGYSTRPGAQEVSLEEEWARVRMGLEAVRSVAAEAMVSIDTFRSQIVSRAYDEFGEFIVNDISAGEMDEKMVATVADLGLKYVAMHMRGTPQTMQQMCDYPDGVAKGVYDYFVGRTAELMDAGIPRENILLDPGFGFAKSVEQNYELLHALDKLHALGYPLLVGLSRKSMIYRPLAVEPSDALPGSLALAWEAMRKGASILRVHDVGATRQIVDLYNLYQNSVG